MFKKIKETVSCKQALPIYETDEDGEEVIRPLREERKNIDGIKELKNNEKKKF